MSKWWRALWPVFACSGGIFAADGVPDFERDVAPLLVDHCLECHQPNKRSGGLNLSTLAGLLKGGEQGPALNAEKPAASLIVERVRGREMPPEDAKEARPLSSAQIETLAAWVAAAAPWPKDRELGIHEKSVDLTEARAFWSFQPVRRAVVPAVAAARASNPIDCFIQERLVAACLTLSPRAVPNDLLRRVSLDVRGLPPSLEEQATFFNDSSPDAYERLVDRLLSDPAYGERWARHWLDLVRYADSNGYERDQAKPSVWRYRDYVIAALNGDKPYDRFVMEQIAGDELPETNYETLIASGFHALGAWQDEVDPLEAAQYRADELDDMVRTTSQTFLGLTLGCARCHNHKFDPLSMVDYYSLVAIVAPLKRPNKSRNDRAVPLGTPEEIAAIEKRDEAIGQIQKQLDVLRVARTEEAKQQIAVLQAQEKELRRATPDLPGAYRCFEDSSEPPLTYLLLSGRASNPGPQMQPRVPVVLTASQPVFPAASGTTLRRLTFAQWLVSPENPLTSRVMVNRVWQHHFGTGLVATSSDFGRMGVRPTHPELLDWLAHSFMHDAEWSLKKLHRMILTSEVYRQESGTEDKGQRTGERTSVDPENELLWRFPYRRLDAEAIRDSMLAAAGNLNHAMYGPAVFLPIPEGAIEAHTDKQGAWKASKEPQINRRTVYAFVKRSLLVPMLETLDFCDTTSSTERRAITSVAPQALTLFNGDFVNRQAEVFAERLMQETGDEPAKQIDLAFRLALAREPTAGERAALIEFVEREAAATDRRRALAQVCRVILNLNEFVYPN